MKTITIALIALAASAPAFAINKCTVGGKTVFQDVPCATGDTVAVKVYSTQTATKKDTQSICEASIRSGATWKDPDSLKFDPATRVGFTTIKLHGTTLAVLEYHVKVSGKNSFGAYTTNTARCYLDGGGDRVIKVAI